MGGQDYPDCCGGDKGETPREFSASDVQYGLTGRTHADNVRHTIVRGAFLTLFFQDEAVQALFQRWRDEHAIAGPLARLTTLWSELGAIASLDTHEQLQQFLSTGALWVPDESNKGRVLAMVEALETALQEVLDGIAEPLSPCQDDSATTFVQELGLNWPWLALELIEEFYREVVALCLNESYVHHIWVELGDEPVPDEAWRRFQSRPGEQRREWLARVLKEHEELQREFAATATPLGRLSKAETATLQRNAEWFYRVRVKRESLRSVTFSHFGWGTESRRKDVYDGMARVEHLLGLTRYTF